MTVVTDVPEVLIVSGVDFIDLAHRFSWGMEYALVPGERPFGPDATPVSVQEIHGGGIVWGFLAPLGLPDKNSYLAVSELLGDDRWNIVVTDINGDNDEEMDAAGRAVLADRMIRGQVKTMTGLNQL